MATGTGNGNAVLPTADRLEIQDLYGRYAVVVDGGDAAAWAECFTDDARFEVAGDDGAVAVGREQIQAFAQAHIDSPRGAVLHHITTLSVSAAEPGAVGNAYAMEVLGVRPISSVRYDDELVKDGDGRWRFAKRVVTVRGLETLD